MSPRGPCLALLVLVGCAGSVAAQPSDLSVPSIDLGSGASSEPTPIVPLPPARPVDLAGRGGGDDEAALRSAAVLSVGPRARLDRVLGAALHRSGTAGELRLVEGPSGLFLAIRLPGHDPVGDEPCEVAIVAEGGEPVSATLAAPVAGLERYRLDAPVCPFELDVLDAALLVSEPMECALPQARCTTYPAGLWTPPLEALDRHAARTSVLAEISMRVLEGNANALRLRAEPHERAGTDRFLAALAEERAALCAAFPEGEPRRFCEARLAAAHGARLAARLGLTGDPAASRQDPIAPLTERVSP